MGWTFNTRRQNKAEFVAEMRAAKLTPGYAILRDALVGNNLWQLVQHPQGFKYVSLIRMEQDAGCWGYKGLDETVGPNYYDCPLSLLDAADEPRSDWAKTFREKVREYHAANKARATLTAGARVQYGGHTYRLVDNLGRKGWKVERADGAVFRMPCTQIKDATLLDAPAPVPAPVTLAAEQQELTLG
jgi:hypothetical protein